MLCATETTNNVNGRLFAFASIIARPLNRNALSECPMVTACDACIYDEFLARTICSAKNNEKFFKVCKCHETGDNTHAFVQTLAHS